MKFTLTLAGALMAATTAFAGDVPMNNAAIANMIAGKTFMLDGGAAIFRADKSYTFSGLFHGKWRVTKRQICVTFDTGMSRCDNVVRNGKQVILIDSNGNRTLMR